MKNKKLFYLSLVFIFLLSIGLTYAYFELNISGNDTAKMITTSSGTLQLEYTDGDLINVSDVYPGWAVNKTIKVTNIGSLDAYYKIYWKELNNSITNNELTVKAVCTSYQYYGTENQVISGTCSDIEETPVSQIANSIKENIGIEVGYTHVYYLTFQFIETSSNQNYNQGREFKGVINIGDSLGRYNVQGLLLSSSSTPLTNTNVTLNEETITTDSEGKFSFNNILVGSYSLEVEGVNDSLNLETGKELEVNDKTISSNIENETINLTVTLGSSSLTYDVSSANNYDINVLALYVDGVKVNSLDANK